MIYITGYVVQVIIFSIFLLYWDTAGQYTHRDGARELLYLGLQSIIYCVAMIGGLLFITKHPLTLITEICIYTIAAGLGIMLFMLDTYIGPLNFSGGMIGIGIPLLMFILFNRSRAYIILGMSAFGFIVLGALAVYGIVPLNQVRIYSSFSNPDHILFDTLCSLYFALPTLVILFLSFDHLLESWRMRQFDIFKISRTDLLSGLLNRRAMTEHLNDVYAECQKNQWPLTLILLDIDHFKSINDLHGHLTGDAVIQYVGKLLSNTTRQVDAVARYGGEEFLMVLKNTTCTQAAAIAERHRILLQDHQFTSDAGQNLSTSASFGIYRSETCSEELQTILSELDKQLYQAKHAGRNCIYIHGERYEYA